MREGPVRPTGTERLFGEDEIIVSKTDVKGVITYANDVFVRVSGYSRDELIGKPHNLIRHPDMPRGVFRLLWDTVSGGDELFAFVNNLAADGAHYWVLAHITPSFGPGRRVVGYHSNRRKPDREAITAVEAVYARMRAAERSHGRAVDAAEAGVRVLQAELAEAGLTYDEYVWRLISGSRVSA